jgi:hypothetical protein
MCEYTRPRTPRLLPSTGLGEQEIAPSEPPDSRGRWSRGRWNVPPGLALGVIALGGLALSPNGRWCAPHGLPTVQGRI